MNGNTGNKAKAGIKPLMEWSSKGRKAEAPSRRAGVKVGAIAEGLADVEPSTAELAFDADAAFDAEREELDVREAEEDLDCGDCGGPCYYWSVKGEPCSMFTVVETPDGVRGPWCWDFELTDEQAKQCEREAIEELNRERTETHTQLESSWMERH